MAKNQREDLGDCGLMTSRNGPTLRECGQLKRKAQQWRSMIGNLRTLEDAA